MSTRKFTNVELMNIHARLMDILRLENKSALAKRLGTTLQNLKNREERGVNKVDDIQLLCNQEKINFKWVVTGQGKPEQFKNPADERYLVDKLVSDAHPTWDAGNAMRLEYLVKEASEALADLETDQEKLLMMSELINVIAAHKKPKK